MSQRNEKWSHALAGKSEDRAKSEWRSQNAAQTAARGVASVSETEDRRIINFDALSARMIIRTTAASNFFRTLAINLSVYRGGNREPCEGHRKQSH